MRWLHDDSRAGLVDALRRVAPHLSGRPIEMSRRVPEEDPTWSSSTAIIDGQFIAKFAWSRPAAARVAHEIGVLGALGGEPSLPYLPEVVASSVDPVLLITRRVSGASLFAVVGSIDRDVAGHQLAEFLAALHAAAARTRVEAATGPLRCAGAGPQHPASARTLRDRLGRWLRPHQRRAATLWCEWADATLAQPLSSVLVHADLHGDNQVWTNDRLDVVVDYENVSAAEPDDDLRKFPVTGHRLELLAATLRHYDRLTGVRLAVDRVMAWHLRNALSDALWRSEAGVPLPDHRTPADWVDDLALRFDDLGIDPARH